MLGARGSCAVPVAFCACLVGHAEAIEHVNSVHPPRAHHDALVTAGARTEFMPLVAGLPTERSKRVRRAVATTWILGRRVADMPVPAPVATLRQEDDPQIRRYMQDLLLHVLEARPAS